MKRLYQIIFWTIILLSIAVMITVYVLRLRNLQYASEPGDFGVFGDYVGGVLGAITGLVSVIFLYFTYMKQIEIYSVQKSQTEHNQFEQTFFHLLDTFGLLRLHLNNKEEKTEGLSYISSFRGLIESYIDKICKREHAFDEFNALETRRKIEEVYQMAFTAESDQLGHYFRSLYHLLKYIN